MPDSKKPVESATAAPGEKRDAAPPPAPAAGTAAESSDPAVHKALADLQAARLNLAAVRDAEQPDVEKYEADEKAALDALKELGYSE